MTAKGLPRSTREHSALMRRVLAKLEQHYGKPKRRVPENLLEEILCAILSQGTTQDKARKAFQRLKNAMEDWNEVRVSTLEEIVEIIPAFSKEVKKARQIRALLVCLFLTQNTLDLDFLLAWPPDKVDKYLRELDCLDGAVVDQIMLEYFGRQSLPVNEDLLRVAKRVGILDAAVRREQASTELENIVPATRMFPFYVLMTRLGVETCTARSVADSRCPIRSMCDAARRRAQTRRLKKVAAHK